MLLAVLRLFAVYLATCAAALALVHRRVVPLSRSVRAFLVLAPLLVTGKAMLTGGIYAPLDIAYQAAPLAFHRSEVGIPATRTPVLGDVVSQEIPWRKAVRESVKNGRLPLWNRFILAGEPLLATQQPAVLHPFTWIGMLLPLAHAWTFEMTIGVFLALLCGYAWLRDLDASPLVASFGAVGWAFSDYLIFWAGYPLSPAIAPFPLLLLGLRRIARDRDARSCEITVAALLLIAAAGHSETLLHAVAAAGLWFLYFLFREARGARARAILVSLAAGAVTLGVMAVVLLPHIEALPHTAEYVLRSGWYVHLKKSVSLSQALTNLEQALAPYALGVSGHGLLASGAGPSNAYIGSAFFPLIVVGLLSKRSVKWLLLGLGTLGIALWAAFPLVTDVVSALPLFDIAINSRLVFLACLAGAAMAALGIEVLAEGRGRKSLGASIVAAVILLTLLFLHLKPRLLALGMTEADLRRQLACQLLPLAAMLLVWIAARRDFLVRVLPVFLAIALAQRAADASWTYPVAPAKAFYPDIPLLDAIPRGEPYRMTAVGFSFVPNISALYGLEDVRGYEAMTFLPLFESYPLWCVYQPVWFNRVDDPTTPFLSFLNVRYVYAGSGYVAPPGWRTIAESSDGKVIENPRALPRAFVPEELRTEKSPAERLETLKTIGDFGKRGILSGDPGVAPDGWHRNGRAEVRIAQYRPQELRLDVSASERTVVGTSVTAWPGWNLEIDGVRSDFVGYNHGFLGFAVPPGRHEVALTYMPISFQIGAGVSCLTLLGIVIRGVRRRLRIAPPPPGISSRPFANDHVDAAQKFWDENHAISEDPLVWMGHPLCRAAINRRVSGNPNVWPLDALTNLVRGRRFERALSLGCGMGNVERWARQTNLCERITGIDISPASLDIARDRARAEGIEGIEYVIGDLNNLRLPERTYDLVFFQQSLHHVIGVEKLLARVSRAMTDDGVIFLDELTGPSNDEWTDRKLARVRRLYEEIPLEWRVHARLTPPILAGDPSEAVRSSAINPSVRMFFDVAERQYGGHLSALLLSQLKPQAARAPELSVFIERWLRLEEEDLRDHPERSYHAVFAGRPHRGARGAVAQVWSLWRRARLALHYRFRSAVRRSRAFARRRLTRRGAL